MKKMKSVQKLFRIGVVVAILVITCCVTAVFAKEVSGAPGLQMVGRYGSYSPIAPDLLVRCQDIVLNENGEPEDDGHGRETVELQYFMAYDLYDFLPEVYKEETDRNDPYNAHPAKDYSFEGFAKAYEKWKASEASPYYALEDLDYAALFKALSWEDQGNNQFALKISPAGVDALINYYNKEHSDISAHSLLKTNEGSIAEHNCTANSNSLKYFSCWGPNYKPATCTENGLQASWCSSCGKIYDEVEIPATGHTWLVARGNYTSEYEDGIRWIVLKKATCTEPGLRVACCVNPWCDESVGTVENPLVQVVPALGHDFSFTHKHNSGKEYSAIHIHYSQDVYAERCIGCGKWRIHTEDMDKPAFEIGEGCALCNGTGDGTGKSDETFNTDILYNPDNWIDGKIPDKYKSGPDTPETPEPAGPAKAPAKAPAEEPAETPAEEPADKPAEEPAETPVEEPTETPVEEPADKPAEEPADAPVEESTVASAIMTVRRSFFTANGARTAAFAADMLPLNLTGSTGDSLVEHPDLDALWNKFHNDISYWGNAINTDRSAARYNFESTGKYLIKTADDGNTVVYGHDQTSGGGYTSAKWIFYKTDENGNKVPAGELTVEDNASIVVDVISTYYTVTWYDADTGAVIRDTEKRPVALDKKQTEAAVAVEDTDDDDFTSDNGKNYTFVTDDARNVLSGTAKWNEKPFALKLYFRAKVTEATYTVKWYDTNGKEIKTAETRGPETAGTNVSATADDKVISGYTFVEGHSDNNLSDVVSADGSTVLKLYFTKNTTPSDPKPPKEEDPKPDPEPDPDPDPDPVIPDPDPEPTPPPPPTLPDPNDPDSPEEVTIIENGVPKTYKKVWDPELEEWVYIEDEDVPLADRTPKTGDDSRTALWAALAAISMAGAVTITAVEKRRKNR